MIQLTKVRLINWYAFSHETAPIGQFTLIAGKNGNGKSVLLDAIKYAAYGDTIIMILQHDVAVYIGKPFRRAHICASRRIKQAARIGIQRTAALAF